MCLTGVMFCHFYIYSPGSVILREMNPPPTRIWTPLTGQADPPRWSSGINYCTPWWENHQHILHVNIFGRNNNFNFDETTSKCPTSSSLFDHCLIKLKIK